MEGYIGEIRMFAGNFAPVNWALCDGQLLPINEHSALFSILGTIYGGDGRRTLALPDLRGRTALHQGQGPGLPMHREGAQGGNDFAANGGDGDTVHTTPYACVNFIICLNGIYPSRD